MVSGKSAIRRHMTDAGHEFPNRKILRSASRGRDPVVPRVDIPRVVGPAPRSRNRNGPRKPPTDAHTAIGPPIRAGKRSKKEEHTPKRNYRIHAPNRWNRISTGFSSLDCDKNRHERNTLFSFMSGYLSYILETSWLKLSSLTHSTRSRKKFSACSGNLFNSAVPAR